MPLFSLLVSPHTCSLLVAWSALLCHHLGYPAHDPYVSDRLPINSLCSRSPGGAGKEGTQHNRRDDRLAVMHLPLYCRDACLTDDVKRWTTFWRWWDVMELV